MHIQAEKDESNNDVDELMIVLITYNVLEMTVDRN